MTKYIGDYDAAASVRFSFNTQDSTGAAITLAGTPAISIYKGGSTTEVTTGVTLTVDYDSRTGLHHVIVDMSSDGTFYAAGSDFRAVITAGTVDSISVVGKEVAHWSVRNRGGVNLTRWLGSAPNSLIQGKVDSLQHIHTGTAQAGGSQTITLAPGASSVDNYYAGQWIIILAGTGAGQAAVRISSYVGSSRVATITTISGAWKTQPDDTSVYAILPSSYIGVDWGDMIRQTTTQGLSGTTIGTVTAISDSRIDNLDATVSTRASEVNASANRITILAAIPGVSAIAAACWAYIITGSTSAATALSYVFSVVSSLVGSGGANSVTITVNDGATAIQSASVSAWSGSTLVATGTTNASGVVVLSLNSATYSINITANGFNGSAGNSLVVSGATSQTYSLTAITITPSDPPEVTGYLYCYDQFGNTQAGVPHTLVLQTAPSGDAGASLSQRPRTVVSASDGLVEFTGLVQEAVYTIKRADGPQTRFTADTETFAITDLAG